MKSNETDSTIRSITEILDSMEPPPIPQTEEAEPPTWEPVIIKHLSEQAE